MYFVILMCLLLQLQHRHLSQPGHSSTTTTAPVIPAQSSPNTPTATSTGGGAHVAQGHLAPIRFSMSRQGQPTQTPPSANTSFRAQVYWV